MSVVLQGNVEPACVIRDLQVLVMYNSQVTITDNDYFASADAQVMVQRNLLIFVNGPAGPPFPPALSDVDPISFNIRPGVVTYEDLDATLQFLINSGGGGSLTQFQWLKDPLFRTHGNNTITYDAGQITIGGVSYTINSSSLTAAHDSLIVATYSGGFAVLSLQVLAFLPMPGQVVIGAYSFGNDQVFLMSGVGQQAKLLPYDNTSSGLTATNVQDAIDELAGAGSANWIAGEILTPLPNGINNVFHTAFTPSTNAETIFYNGEALVRGIGKDYTITGSTVTLSFVPESAAALTANYFHS